MTASTWMRDAEIPNRYGFQGKEWEDKTQWYDFHARQYDPVLGRWFALDPANQFASGYMGMGNNPMIGVDPDGRVFWLIPPLLIGAYTGAFFGTHQAIVSGDKWYNGFWKGALLGAVSGLAAPFAPAGILPGFGYGAATGAAIGAAQAALFGTNIGKGALFGAITGGVFGGINGGITAAKAGGDIWTGKLEHAFTKPSNAIRPIQTGKKVKWNQETLTKFVKKQFPGHKGWVTMEHRPSGYKVNADGSWKKEGLKDGVLGVTRPSIWGGYKISSKIYVSVAAFASEPDLFETLGHELTHYQHYADGLLAKYESGKLEPSDYFSFDEMTERGAWEYTRNAAIKNRWYEWIDRANQYLVWPGQYQFSAPPEFKSRVNQLFTR